MTKFFLFNKTQVDEIHMHKHQIRCFLVPWVVYPRDIKNSVISIIVFCSSQMLSFWGLRFHDKRMVTSACGIKWDEYRSPIHPTIRVFKLILPVVQSYRCRDPIQCIRMLLIIHTSLPNFIHHKDPVLFFCLYRLKNSSASIFIEALLKQFMQKSDLLAAGLTSRKIRWLLMHVDWDVLVT